MIEEGFDDTDEQKIGKLSSNIDSSPTDKSCHVPRRLSIKIRFIDYCRRRQVGVARLICQNLIIRCSWCECYYFCDWNERGRGGGGWRCWVKRCPRYVHCWCEVIGRALKTPICYIWGWQQNSEFILGTLEKDISHFHIFPRVKQQHFRLFRTTYFVLSHDLKEKSNFLLAFECFFILLNKNFDQFFISN